MAHPTTEQHDELSATEPESSLLINVQQLARMLKRSAASLERDQKAGRLPAQIYVGGSKRWRRAEIEAWVAAGCPIRTEWEALLADQRGAAHVA